MQPSIDFSYQDLIKTEFEARIAKNAHYSMRAFARDLGMTAQMIGAVLNRKKDLSIDSAAAIAGRLNFDPLKTQDLLDAVIMAGCRTAIAKKIIHQRIEERNRAPD